MCGRFGNYGAPMTTSPNSPKRRDRAAAIASALLLLAGCGRPQGADTPVEADEVLLTPSPDSKGAAWRIAANGLGIHFGKNPAAPYVSLGCKLSSSQPPQLSVIRHASSDPGAKALFAVLGNGIAARFKVDAVMAKGEGWRWEETLPASAGQFDVFSGPREIEATLPGAGMIVFPPSNLPREFIDWCRRNGEDLPAPETELSPPPPA
jgi:hypothetical protein